jgi:hypothetical protein
MCQITAESASLSKTLRTAPFNCPQRNCRQRIRAGSATGSNWRIERRRQCRQPMSSRQPRQGVAHAECCKSAANIMWNGSARLLQTARPPRASPAGHLFVVSFGELEVEPRLEDLSRHDPLRPSLLRDASSPPRVCRRRPRVAGTRAKSIRNLTQGFSFRDPEQHGLSRPFEIADLRCCVNCRRFG